MAIVSIDWGARVIHVPKSYLQVVQLIPTEIYNLNLNDFRLTLKDLEDSDAGMAYLRTHNHNTTVTLSGITYARIIEIINGYTITFEDGQYAVNLVGANSNIADVTNVNSVSIRPNNSAGLVEVASGSGLSSEQDALLVETERMVERLHRLGRLDPNNPLTVTPISMDAGDIHIEITGDGETISTFTSDS